MDFPTVNEIRQARESIDAFSGLDRRERIPEGSFSDMMNMSSVRYPSAGPRLPRGERPVKGGAPAMLLGDTASFTYVSGGHVYRHYDDVDDDMPLGTTVVGDVKQMIRMGAYILLFPQKVWVLSTDYNDLDAGSMEAEAVSSGTVTYTLCDAEGNDYGGATEGASAPASPADGALWLDTSGETPSLKKYSAAAAQWAAIASTCVKISFDGLSPVEFSEGDGVKLDGIARTAGRLREYDGKYVVLRKVGDGFAVIDGVLPAVTVRQTSALTVSRKLPVMDFVCESGNRLWGCRYGENADGAFVNEIYASKLGDFKNFSCFEGLSTDSYAATVGTDGPFTAAVAYQGIPTFFKEKHMHRVYGYYPAAFRVQTDEARGVQEGCERTLAVVNEALYYKSRQGVCVYDGSYPATVSEALGETAYDGPAAAGPLGKRYYISMKNSGTGRYELLVYDTKLGIWHKEDDTRATVFSNVGNVLYYIDADRGRVVTAADADGGERVKWFCETGPIGVRKSGTTDPYKKTLSMLTVRLQTALGAKAVFYAQYDSMGPWAHLATVTGASLRAVNLPMRPQRCDHLRLKIVGEGDVRIWSLTKTIERGSET